MDNELRIIQYLYGEADQPEKIESELADNPKLRRAYEEMREVKQHLDERSAARPDAEVIDRVMDAAEAPRQPASAERSGDRDPAEPQRSPAVRRGVIGAVLVAVLAVGIVFVGGESVDWPLGEPSEPATETVAAETAAESEDGDRALPAWDEGDRIIQMQGYIETLQSRSSANSWDAADSYQIQPTGQTTNGR